MTTEIKAALLGLWTLACLVAGYLICDHWQQQQPVAATVHAQERLSDGSVRAARTEPAPDTKPATAVPAGDKPVAVAHMQVAAGKPVYVDAHKSDHKPPIDCTDYVAHLTCPAVSVDETLVKDKTGQLDLVVKGAEQATLTPIAPTFAPAEHQWAAGATYGVGRRWGGFVDRDFGPIRVGAEIEQAPQTGFAGRLKLGWRF